MTSESRTPCPRGKPCVLPAAALVAVVVWAELRELAIRAHIRRAEIDLDRQRQSLRRPA